MSWRKYMIDANWNIGFCEQTPEDYIRTGRLNRIQWLKHPYKDRWFADPYIFWVTTGEIVVFVEECMLSDYPKGIICELVIDRKTMRLKERYVMLELETHLSYPAIIKHKGKIYVYPENGASGKLNIYEYDETNHRLVNPICILDEAVADATILEKEGKYLIVATKYPETQEKAYLYESDSLFGPFKLVSVEPFQPSRSCARPGGNWIKIGSKIYRPAQDCSKRYGGALSIMEVKWDNATPHEEQVCRVTPIACKYSRGVHTINFNDGLCVVDGYGYLYQVVGRLFKVLVTLKRMVR